MELQNFIEKITESAKDFIEAVEKIKCYAKQQYSYMEKLQRIYDDNLDILKLERMKKMKDAVYYEDDYGIVYVKHDGMISKYKLIETVIDLNSMNQGKNKNEIW